MIVLWSIWLERNRKVFHNKSVHPKEVAVMDIDPVVL